MTDIPHGSKIKRTILDAGLRIWDTEGMTAITASRLGREVGLSHNAIRYHFGSSDGAFEAVANYAVLKAHSKIICQLIAYGHPAVSSLSNSERNRHLATMKKPA